MKKVLSCLIAIALVLGLFPADFCVSEAKAVKATYVFGDYGYTLDKDGSASIVKYSGSTASAAIPSELDGHTVKSIGNRVFEGHKELTSIQIPESVIAIGRKAFTDTGLKSLELPSKLETIGNQILTGVEGVKEIKIPKSVKNTGGIDAPYNGSFGGSSLESVEFEEGMTILPAYALSDCKNLTSVKIPDSVAEIGNCAFKNCKSLFRISIPQTVVKIGREAFTDTGLKSLELPSKLETIGNQILTGVEGVKEIKIPKSVKNTGGIGAPYNGSFGGSSLESVEFEEGMTILPAYALSDCKNLTSVKIPDSVVEIGNCAFQNTALQSFELPPNIKKLGKKIFLNVPIIRLTIPSSLESANETFSGSELTDVTFENGTKKVVDSLFTDCSKLKNVVLPDEVSVIGRSAFKGCTTLSTLTLPVSVMSIDNYAFKKCTALEDLYVRHNITDIGKDSFKDCPALYVRGPLYSNTMLAMVNRENNMSFTDTTYKDESTKVLDHFNSSYEINTVSSSGYTTLNLEYAIKSKAADHVSDMQLIVKLPSTSIIKEIRLDGKKLKEGNATDENLITVPVTQKSGKCQIFTTPGENGRIVSYALLNYNNNQKKGTDIIGAVSEDCSHLTLQLPDTVGYEKNKGSVPLDIHGFGQKEKDVEVFLDGKLVNKTTVSKGGIYSSKITLMDPKDYKTYQVRVKSVDKNGNDVEIAKPVKTVGGEPELESAQMYMEVSGKEFDLMNSEHLLHHVTFRPGKAYYFTVKYKNKDKIAHVYVVSNRGGISKKLEAYYDAEKDAYITKGFFDNNSNYVPGNLSIQYTTKTERPVINSDGTVTGLSDREKNSVPGKWKNATVKENTSSKSDYEADITLGSGEVLTYTYDAMSFTEYAEELEKKQAEKTAGQSQDNPRVKRRSVSRGGADAIGDVIDILKLFDKEEIDDIGNVYDFLVRDGFIKYATGEADLEKDVALMKTDFSNGKMVYYLINPDASENIIQKYVFEKGNDAIQSTVFDMLGVNATAAGFAIDSVSNLAELCGTEMDVLRMKQAILMDPSLTKGQREAKLKEVQKIADIAETKALFTLLSSALGVAATMTGATGVGIGLGMAALVIDKVVIPLIESGELDDFLRGKISLEDLITRWIIDPSGYVYEGVTNNRISGATTTVYYKETLESNEIVKWDASEYDQVNPLKTDAQGGYSWDVPEGYWQVKVELDGYETAYSEWLEVPPPQTDVNIKLNRKEKPIVDSFEAYETFAVLTFSQYMSPETVKNVQLQDADGNELKYLLSYPGDETDTDGNVYARRYILSYENKAEKSKMMHLVIGDGVKSSSGISAVQEKRTTSIVQDLGIVGDDYVKIAIEDTFNYEFQLEDYANEGITIQIDNPSIVECVQSDKISMDGKGEILFKPLAYGSAAITISVEGKKISKKIDVSVCDETVSGKRESTDVNLPSFTDKPSQTPQPPTPTQTPKPDQSEVQGPIGNQGTANEKTGKPAKVSSLKLKAKKKSFTAKWKKVKGAKGYQIQYAVSKKKLSKGKQKNTKKTTVTIKKLQKKKTYYVRVRAYRKPKKIIYGRWSAVQKVKIRK